MNILNNHLSNRSLPPHPPEEAAAKNSLGRTTWEVKLRVVGSDAKGS